MEPLLQSVADYYTDKVARFGASARGVDWNSADGQRLRFSKLLRVTEDDEAPFSLDDYGCGYGALFTHLETLGCKVDYLGFDVSPRMVEQARAVHCAQPGRFLTGSRSPRTADYAVASGIFNVRLSVPVDEWERHILEMLDLMHHSSIRGFAFNCLTDFSDPPFRRDHLYYAKPGFYLDLCLRRYSRTVALLHDYGLYEFTVLVKKPRQP